MDSFDSLSIKQLKHILLVKGKSLDTAKRSAIQSQVANAVEKIQLTTLAKENISPDEIESLLQSAAPNASTASTSAASTSTAQPTQPQRSTSTSSAQQPSAAYETNPANVSPDQMRQQASMMRNNPDVVRRSHPMFSKMTDAQLREYANQLDAIAANPNMMKEVEKQMAKFSPKERESLMIIQEGLTGARPTDDKWLDHSIETLKKHPDLFKTLFNGRTAPAGVTDDQIKQFIDVLASMDASTLKYLFKTIKFLGGFAEPAQQMYKKIDQKTGGFAKVIIAIVVIVVLSLLAWLTWKVVFAIASVIFSYLKNLIWPSTISTATDTLSTAATTTATTATVATAGSTATAAAVDMIQQQASQTAQNVKVTGSVDSADAEFEF